uniref:Uncharacterized protein n=2 Tax=Aegilops tauschii TaxID=37682 RepID=A0A453D4M3_AEGTS
MCNVITIPSVAWLRRAVRRWRARRSTSAPVLAGHGALCAEGVRFMVRLAHLSHPAFLELIRQAEEEYGSRPAPPAPSRSPAARTASATSSAASLPRPTPRSRAAPPSAAAAATRGRCFRGWPSRDRARRGTERSGDGAHPSVSAARNGSDW